MSDKSNKSIKNTDSIENEQSSKKKDLLNQKISSQALGFYSYMYFKMKSHLEKDHLTLDQLIPLYTAQTKEYQIPTRDATIVQKPVFPFQNISQQDDILLREYANRDWGYKYTEETLYKNINFNSSILNALYKVVKVEECQQKQFVSLIMESINNIDSYLKRLKIHKYLDENEQTPFGKGMKSMFQFFDKHLNKPMPQTLTQDQIDNLIRNLKIDHGEMSMISVFKQASFYQLTFTLDFIRLLDWDVENFMFLSLKQGILKIFGQNHDWGTVFQKITMGIQQEQLNSVMFPAILSDQFNNQKIDMQQTQSSSEESEKEESKYD